MSVFDIFRQQRVPNCDWCESETRRSAHNTVEAITERMFKMQKEHLDKEDADFRRIMELKQQINNLEMENHALYKILESHNIKVDCSIKTEEKPEEKEEISNDTRN